jgi:hypothetical protein
MSAHLTITNNLHLKIYTLLESVSSTFMYNDMASDETILLNPVLPSPMSLFSHSSYMASLTPNSALQILISQIIYSISMSMTYQYDKLNIHNYHDLLKNQNISIQKVTH